jgi:uncharacterized protein (TIGR03437 family)
VAQTDAKILPVTPTLVYVLTPVLEARGEVAVELSNANGSTGSTTVTITDRTIGIQPRGPVALAWHEDGTLVGPLSEFTEPWMGRPALSGETIVLSTSGVAGIDDLERIEVFAGDQACTVTFLMDGQPGQQKLYAQLPTLSAGDYALTLKLDGTAAAKTLNIPVA